MRVLSLCDLKLMSFTEFIIVLDLGASSFCLFLNPFYTLLNTPLAGVLMQKTIFTRHAAQVASVDASFRNLFVNRNALHAIQGVAGEVSPALRRAIDAVTMPLIEEDLQSGRSARAVISLDGFTPILLYRAGTEDPHTVALQIFRQLSSSLGRVQPSAGSKTPALTSATPSKGEIPEMKDIVSFLTSTRSVYNLDSERLGANLGIVSLEQYPSLPPGKLYCIANMALLLDLPPLVTEDGTSLPKKSLTLDLKGESRNGTFELVVTTESRYSSARGNYPSACSVLFADPEFGYDFTTDELRARGMVPPTSFHMFPDGTALFRVFIRNGRAALFVPDSSGLKVPESDDFRTNGIF